MQTPRRFREYVPTLESVTLDTKLSTPVLVQGSTFTHSCHTTPQAPIDQG